MGFLVCVRLGPSAPERRATCLELRAAPVVGCERQASAHHEQAVLPEAGLLPFQYQKPSASHAFETRVILVNAMRRPSGDGVAL